MNEREFSWSQFGHKKVTRFYRNKTPAGLLKRRRVYPPPKTFQADLRGGLFNSSVLHRIYWMAVFSKLHPSYPLPATVNSSRDFSVTVGISGKGGGDVHLHVTCALIEKEGRVLCTRRSAGMTLPLKWEFPGGKIKEGESLEGCLRRELFEELGVDVKVGRELPPVTHRYPEFEITLHPFLCTIEPSEKITLHEHDQAAWTLPEDLGDIDWAAADVGVVKNYLVFRTRSGKGSGNPRGMHLTKDKTP